MYALEGGWSSFQALYLSPNITHRDGNAYTQPETPLSACTCSYLKIQLQILCLNKLGAYQGLGSHQGFSGVGIQQRKIH